MNLNPLALIDSLLKDWTSPRVRRLIHGLLSLALALVALWSATEGNWQAFAAALAAALYTESNRANTGVSGNDDTAEDGTLF